MKKLFYALLSLPFIALSQAAELDLSLTHFAYENGDGGEFKADILSSSLRDFNFELDENKQLFARIKNQKNSLRLNAGVYFKKSYISLLNFTTPKSEIPFHDDINYLNVIGLDYYQNDDESRLAIDRAHLDSFGVEALIMNIRGECNRVSGMEYSVVSACLNNSYFGLMDKSLDESHVEIVADDLITKFDLQELSFEENHMKVNLTDIDVEFGKWSIYAEDLELECMKTFFDDKVSAEQVTKGCLSKGDIKVPLLKVDNGVDIAGEVSVQHFFSNKEKMMFSTNEIEFGIKGSHLLTSKVTANCKTPKLGDDFEMSDIVTSCLDSGGFSIYNLDFDTNDSRVDTEEIKFNITDKSVSLVSPHISIRMIDSEFVLNIYSPRISCEKPDMENISMDLILEACFNSSSFIVPSITLEHPTIDSNIEISEISIDKNELKLRSPYGKYQFNENINEYEDLHFFCKLTAEYKIAKNLEWKSILKNCLHNSKIKLGSLDSEDTSQGFFRSLFSDFTGLLIQSVRSVRFSTLSLPGDKFEARIYPKIIGFIPAGGTLRGHINYNEEDNTIVIKIDRFKFYNLVPAKAVAEFILEAFVEDETIDVDGNTITIKLGDEEQDQEL